MSLTAAEAVDRLDASRRHLQRALRVTARAPAGAEVLRGWCSRHPLGLVAGAALAGGLLAWSRPWRWVARPGLLTSLCRQLVHEAVVQGWLQGLVSQGVPRRAAAPVRPHIPA